MCLVPMYSIPLHLPVSPAPSCDSDSILIVDSGHFEPSYPSCCSAINGGDCPSSATNGYYTEVCSTTKASIIA